MFKDRIAAALLIAAAGIAAVALFWPFSGGIAELRAFPPAYVTTGAMRPVAAAERARDAQKIQPAEPGVTEGVSEKAVQGSASPGVIETRQWALIVILLATLGVATRLLWRRHLRALSCDQDADVDEK